MMRSLFPRNGHLRLAFHTICSRESSSSWRYPTSCTIRRAISSTSAIRQQFATTTADDRSGYSATWTAVDQNRHDPNAMVTPDPVAYLYHFDRCPATQAYRQGVIDAANLQPGMSVLNVGCGLGGLTPLLRQKVGPTGTILSVDLSSDLVKTAREAHPGETFQVGNVYNLMDIPSNSFDVVLEDRMLQHLTRPQEALQEMMRVCRPGGSIVCGQPDWRTFVMDVTSAGYHRLGESGRRWGEMRRPPPDLQLDLGQLTRRVLEGVIPQLNSYSYLGVSLPRLFRSVGMAPKKIDLTIIPAIMQGRKTMETVVPITYFSRLAINNGTVTADEAQAWLDRLEWEEEEAKKQELFGTMNFYVCRGTKPIHYTLNAQVQVATQTDPAFVDEVTRIVNQAYRYSDYDITLCTERIPAKEIVGIIERQELLVARDLATGEVLGAIQTEVKGTGAHAGLPNVGMEDQLVGEFSMLAVKMHKNKTSGGTVGIGSMLVRAAEFKCRDAGCSLMNLGILCPADKEPEYKQWLQKWYLKLGYEHRETIYLRFEPDEIREMYSYLGQVVPCKYILFDKAL